MSDIDLEFWMTNLSSELRTTPLIYLAIPGSHDSGTFGITPDSKVAPDAETVLQILSNLFPCITNRILTQWSVTQYYTIRQQLYKGIRYIDCRIATSKISDLFYITHSLYSESVNLVFQEIKDFLDLHPKEVVFLDCQHFYDFETFDHKRFAHLVTKIFGNKLQPYNKEMKSVTLDSMTQSNQYQLIFIYRESSINLEPQFWPPECLPNPWADMVVSWNLIDFLTEELKNRNYNFGYVSQCILTPSLSYILRHVFSNLINECFIPLEEDKYKWLIQQKPGPGGINIIISDFVDYADDEFAKAVIGLNEKLGVTDWIQKPKKIVDLED